MCHYPFLDISAAYSMNPYCRWSDYQVAFMKTKQTRNYVVMTVILVHALGEVIWKRGP